MSYLEMSSAPLSDMSKGIISLWFRDLSAGEAPEAEKWPQGYWTEGTASDTMMPPNAQYLAGQLGAGPGQITETSIFWWNAYGVAIGGPILGNLFMSPTLAGVPSPPPFAINTIRMLLTFGDPDQDYDFHKWSMTDPGVIDAVQYKDLRSGAGLPVGFNPNDYPAPYAPYSGDRHDVSAGPHIGLIKNKMLKIDDGPTNKPKMVPQSFIGIDKNGYITINLQTDTKADFTGYWYGQESQTELWTTTTILKIREPHTYTQVGFPFPDGDWVSFPGYWDGYQFTYKDISNEIMACCGESFLIGGAPVGFDSAISPPPHVAKSGKDTWHHLLFSFDISGSVDAEQSPGGNEFLPLTSVTSSCKAWLALDDKNYDSNALQHKPFVYDGGPNKLEGTNTTSILDGLSGPVYSFKRSEMGLKGDNDIAPRNAWLNGGGFAKNFLTRYASGSGVLLTPAEAAAASTPVNPAVTHGWASPGDFNPLAWTGSLWPLYGDGVAPGPWLAVKTPKAPNTPDPKDFDYPKYRCSGFSIPVKGFPIGVPVSGRHVDHNTGLEMAELQIWAGQTLDTGEVDMRRLFIDKNGKPVSMKKAEEMLGKPDIKLHGSGNWKQGRNTGSAGIDDEGKPVPSGQFARVAAIEKFTPDPQLRK